MEIKTCPICNNTIELNFQGKLQYCKCKCLSIDSTKEYTRYLGIIAKEDPNYQNWKHKNKKIIKRIRKLIKK